MPTYALDTTGENLQKSQNLADVPSAATSRTNLGLGTSDSPSFAGLTVSASAVALQTITSTSTGDAYTKWISTIGDSQARVLSYSDGGNYIESGNAAFTGNQTLSITGYNSNIGNTLDLHFASVTVTGGTGQDFTITGLNNTAHAYGLIQNSDASADFYYGVEASVGGTTFPGSIAKAGFIATFANTPLQFWAHNHLALTLDPVAGDTIVAQGLTATTLSLTGGSGQDLTITGPSTTAHAYELIQNSDASGDFYIGIESSTPGATFSSTLAKCGFVATFANTVLQLYAHNVLGLTVNTTGTIYMPHNIGIGAAPTATSPLHISGLPTSSAGLAAGDVWNNGGVLCIV